MLTITAATTSYETWLGTQLALVPADLDTKHAKMTQNAFSFFRATFYRWMQLWPLHCAAMLDAPLVLAIGDLHVANFGTWRDSEGRLVWGVNDFDEAYPLPYTHDLVRLAVSARLAIADSTFSLTPAAAEAALLDGYTAALQAGGQPFILAEQNAWLRDAALSSQREPAQFWAKLRDLPNLQTQASVHVPELLVQALPTGATAMTVQHRTAGAGSLGRQRWLALATWRGGTVARELKALAASACVWAGAAPHATTQYYQTLLNTAIRAPDPTNQLLEHWSVRRLAPDCARIELSELARKRDEPHLLRAMGWETANIHLGTAAAANAIQQDLQRRGTRWLSTAAAAMYTVIIDDWRAWRQAK